MMNAHSITVPPTKPDAPSDLPVWRRKFPFQRTTTTPSVDRISDQPARLSHYRLVMTCSHRKAEHNHIEDTTPRSEPSNNRISVAKEVTR